MYHVQRQVTLLREEQATWLFSCSMLWILLNFSPTYSKWMTILYKTSVCNNYNLIALCVILLYHCFCLMYAMPFYPRKPCWNAQLISRWIGYICLEVLNHDYMQLLWTRFLSLVQKLVFLFNSQTTYTFKVCKVICLF